MRMTKICSYAFAVTALLAFSGAVAAADQACPQCYQAGGHVECRNAAGRN